jgi:hypothetical protein
MGCCVLADRVPRCPVFQFKPGRKMSRKRPLATSDKWNPSCTVDVACSAEEALMETNSDPVAQVDVQKRPPASVARGFGPGIPIFVMLATVLAVVAVIVEHYVDLW